MFSNFASKMASSTSNLSMFFEKTSSRSSTVRTNWFRNVTVDTLKWFSIISVFCTGTGCSRVAFSSNLALAVGLSMMMSGWTGGVVEGG